MNRHRAATSKPSPRLGRAECRRRPRHGVLARGSAAALVLAPVLAAALTWATPAAAQDISELVARYGLRPVTPPAPASDFTLTNLQGGETSLSEFRGSWVLLTFWATWCGPCRGEMPTLQRVHEERGSQGLKVVGVSVDDSRVPVDPYVEKMGLTFPMLWDGRGQAARAYRASSIPLTYLIDPEGLVVAISRGARDWGDLIPMLDAVASLEPPGAGAAGAYTAAQAPLDLPEVLDPPSAELSLSTENPAVGEVFELTVRMHWAGNFEEYLPQPPQVALPEGVEQRSMSAATSSQDGRNLVTYTLALTASEPGRYALDPVELRYTPRFGSEPVASRLTGPTVTVQARTWAGLTPRQLLWGLGGVTAAGLALGLGLWLRRRHHSAGTAGSDDDGRWSELRARLDAARAARLRGDGATAVLELARLELELSAETGGDAAAEDRLKDLMEGARYGGRIPPTPELDRMERRVERRIAELRPDPEREQRAALRLRQEGHGVAARPTISEETR